MDNSFYKQSMYVTSFGGCQSLSPLINKWLKAISSFCNIGRYTITTDICNLNAIRIIKNVNRSTMINFDNYIYLSYIDYEIQNNNTTLNKFGNIARTERTKTY